MTSTSGNDGSAAIIVTFDLTRNLDVAAVDVQNRISQVSGRLPTEVNAVGISVTKVSTNFVLAAGAYCRERRVRHALHQQLRRSLHQGRAEACRRRRRRLRVRRAPLRDASVARSRPAGGPRTSPPTKSSQALREQNVQVAAGQVGQPPSEAGQTYQISVRAVGRLIEPAQFEDIILKRSGDGALVRREGRRPHRARRGELRAGGALQRPRRDRLRRPPAADRQLASGLSGRHRDARPAVRSAFRRA